MKRLIDADELMKYLYDNYESDCYHNDDDNWSAGRASAWWAASVHVDDAPVVEAIPVEWLMGLMLSTEDENDEEEYRWIMREWDAEKDDL